MTDSYPMMLDVSVSYNRYKFLGHEFLTWLWFLIEKNPDLIKQLNPDLASLETGNQIILENSTRNSLETITIKGDDAGLEEGILALKKGAVVTELNLQAQSAELKWQFTLKGESFNVSNFKTPETGPIETDKDIAGAVLEKAFLYENIMSLIDTLFKHFITLRISTKWNADVVPLMRAWIRSAGS
jgi:hypothetical protein